MLYSPIMGCGNTEDNQGTTAAEYGTSVVGNTTGNSKNPTYTQLRASTAYDAWGVFIGVYNTGVATTRTGVLLDIATGGAASETVIIPNLIAGFQGTSAGAQGAHSMYYFPIVIPAGTRVSGTCQGFAANETVNVTVYLMQQKLAGVWYGQRVTDYGANTTGSTGTSMSPGNSTYATPVSVSANTTNPIKYMQIGTDCLTNNNAVNSRGLARITIGAANVMASDLPYGESTTLETVNFATANFILSQMRFNIPAGVDLRISAMRNAVAATRGWVVYGVD